MPSPDLSLRANVALKLSPTAMNTWLTCRRQYFFQYVERKPAGPAKAHFSLGNSLHSALRDYALPVGEQLPPAELLNKNWITAGYRDAEMSEQIKSVAHVWLEQYLLNEGELAPIGVERSVEYPRDDYVLSGRIDRIDRRMIDGQEQLVIVDYKTGKGVPTEAEARGSLALAFYAVAAWRLLRTPCYRVELHHLPSGTRAVATHTQESLTRQGARLDSVAQEILEARAGYEAAPVRADELFEPQPSAICRWCDFRDFCPEGQLQGEAVAPWQGVLDVLAEAELLESLADEPLE